MRGDFVVSCELNQRESEVVIERRLKWAAVMTICLLGGPASACVKTDFGSCFERPDGRLVFIEPAFEDYMFMLFDICDAMKIDYCSYPLLMGDLGFNAMAARIEDVGDVIIYDRKLSLLVGGDGAEAIIAHELAHIKCGHLETSYDMKSSHLAELEADRFAGAAMKRMGRPRETLGMLVDVLEDQPTLSHPGKEDRIMALQQGYDSPDSAMLCAGWKDERPK